MPRFIILRRVNKTNLMEGLALRVKPDQAHFAPELAYSLSLAYTSFASRTWIPYLIYRDEVAVGAATFSFADNDETNIGLSGFFIAAEYQQQGLGGIAMKLMETEVVQTWPRACVLSLMVHVDNSVAFSFYEKNGYIRTRELYRNEELMRKAIR